MAIKGSRAKESHDNAKHSDLACVWLEVLTTFMRIEVYLRKACLLIWLDSHP